jgi:FixJ family two-component response regulator
MPARTFSVKLALPRLFDTPRLGDEMSASSILVVDDHTASRDALVALLCAEGFTVTAFSSAVLCLAECDFRDVACAVVSQPMQGMTGFELAKAFQSGWLEVPTILLADTLPAGLRDRADAGVIAVLGLPPDPAALCDLLRKTVASLVSSHV